jgi:OOP family OmpA-OmpF porin
VASRAVASVALPLTLLCVAGAVDAQRGPVELGAFGTLASFAPSYDLRLGIAGGGRLGYRWRPGWAVELELGAGAATISGGGRSVPVGFAGLHALRYLDADRQAWFVLAGYGRPSFRGTPPGRFSDDAVTLGIGRQTPIQARLSLRTELRGLYSFSSGGTGRGAGHILAVVGLSLAPGGHPAADADSDGVGDRRDDCLRTPTGAVVDPRGCPFDSDGDGRFDGLDRCPNTSAGVLTDPLGCPIDSDRDGVYDGVDQCPGTLSGSDVDLRGCTIITDRDRAQDTVDHARDTMALFPGERASLVLEGVTFESGSARLVPSSFATLDRVAASLLAHPDVRIEVAGYTDNTGSAAANRRLSAQRAGAVRDYLRLRGVPQERMRAAGYGPANPVALNATPEGRARNRRVELHRVL